MPLVEQALPQGFAPPVENDKVLPLRFKPLVEGRDSLMVDVLGYNPGNKTFINAL